MQCFSPSTGALMSFRQSDLNSQIRAIFGKNYSDSSKKSLPQFRASMLGLTGKSLTISVSLATHTEKLCRKLISTSFCNFKFSVSLKPNSYHRKTFRIACAILNRNFHNAEPVKTKHLIKANYRQTTTDPCGF